MEVVVVVVVVTTGPADGNVCECMCVYVCVYVCMCVLRAICVHVRVKENMVRKGNIDDT